MNLRDFIHETLVQITKGIVDADAALSSDGAAVNPQNVVHNTSGNGPSGYYVDDEKDCYRRVIHQVEFDVVLSVSDSKESKSGIGIHVGALGIGTMGKTGIGNSSESRIKFSVPVLFPKSKNA